MQIKQIAENPIVTIGIDPGGKDADSFVIAVFRNGKLVGHTITNDIDKIKAFYDKWDRINVVVEFTNLINNVG